MKTSTQRTEVRMHACAVCDRRVPLRLLMCGPHWALVPAAQQLAVYRTWRQFERGGFVERLAARAAYLAARDAAIAGARQALITTKGT